MTPFFSYLSLITIFLFLFNPPVSIFCEDVVDYRYSNCSQNFNCGSVQNIAYPFWGGTRAADYCGHPSFKLECAADGTPTINIMSNTYTVLGINQTSHSLNVTRNDTWDGNCPAGTISGNATFTFRLFSYSDSTLQNLTMFSDCPSLSSNIPNQVTCSREDFSILNGEPLDLVAEYPQLLSCPGVTIIGPASNFNSSESTVEEVVEAGFGLKYVADAAYCNYCENSGGHCGYNQTNFAVICFCTDGPRESTCGNGSNQVMILGIGVIDLLRCILLVGCGYHLRELKGDCILSSLDVRFGAFS